MSDKNAVEFLKKYGQSPELIDPALEAKKMLADMERGLNDQSGSMPMIPTYLKNDGAVPEGSCAVVIDAGGTNFRCALVRFGGEGYSVEQMRKCKMPGIEKPATWEEFISFTADMIEPLMGETDKIGFCFSYSAQITPEIDGKVDCIDKEVVITGSAGQLVGASLLAELERRGIKGKSVAIVNDTAAVMLGASALMDKSAYSGFIGQVSGTGTNTCCTLPYSKIGKLHKSGETPIIVNLESGMYDGMPRGRFDNALDAQSNNPGAKHMEKMTSGAYLGELCRMMLMAAAEDGLLSTGTADRLSALGRIDSSVADAWASGERLDEICTAAEEGEFVKTVCLAAFERSARCLCTNILAIMLLTGAGLDAAKPMCVCAEGSLVQRSRHFRPMLEGFLKTYGEDKLARYAVLNVANETTLPGSAAAAILNV